VRILFITDKFVPERGGSQIIFGQLYAHLPEHEVTVVTREWPGHQECDALYPHRVIRLPYAPIPKLRSPLLWKDLARMADQLLSTGKYDQLHCGQTVETAPAGAWLARKHHLPMVVHTFAEDVTTYLKHAFYGPLMRRGLRGASVVTSISEFTVEHLCRIGVPRDRVTLLHPGVVVEDWAPRGQTERIHRELEIESRKVILTISRLIPRKGQDTMLRALPTVLAQVPDAVYVIVGGGPEEVRLRALAKELNVERSVRFVGSIPNADTVDYYHACDVFAMPNREMPNGDIEGFGLVFLEAGVCGKPVIGGRSGGAVDAIAHGESGYLVNPLDPTELAARLIELLADPAHARAIGAAGRQRVLNSFTWAHSGQVLHRAIALASAVYRGRPTGLPDGSSVR